MKEVILEEKEEFNKMNRGGNIYFDGSFVSRELVKNILEKDNYFNYTLSFFKDEIPFFHIKCKGNPSYVINHTKKEIIRAMEIYVSENNDKDNTRFKLLKDIIYYDKMRKKYQNKRFGIDIDNIHYDIKTSDIMEFLDTNHYDFEKMCDNNAELFGIPKEHFVYAVKYFLEKEDILNNYYFPSNFEMNVRDILYDYVDIVALNILLKTEDALHLKIELDKELEGTILGSMPNDFSLLEKALYVYIMLCKTLTYDEEFYATDESDEANLKHQDYRRVEHINSKNNRVTCYEFNLLYAKFLSKLGINFKSFYLASNDKEAYGDGHVFLNFRVGKYLVHADAVEQILYGDIAEAKRNNMLGGIKLINKNSVSQREFNESLEKVYSFISERENKTLYGEESFESLVSEYRKLTNNYNSVDLKTKIHIIMNKINNSDYIGVDAMSYILALKKCLFTYDEKYYHIRINIVGNKDTNSDDIKRLSVIFTIDNQEYFLFTPHGESRELTFDELKKLFDKGILSYLENDSMPIEGIKRGK